MCVLVLSCLFLIKLQPLCRMFDVTDVLVTSSPQMTEHGENDCGFATEKHLSSAALSSRACKISCHEQLSKMKRRNVHPCEAPANARMSLRSKTVCIRMSAVLLSLMGQREVEENLPKNLSNDCTTWYSSGRPGQLLNVIDYQRKLMS